MKKLSLLVPFFSLCLFFACSDDDECMASEVAGQYNFVSAVCGDSTVTNADEAGVPAIINYTAVGEDSISVNGEVFALNGCMYEETVDIFGLTVRSSYDFSDDVLILDTEVSGGGQSSACQVTYNKQ